MFRPPRCPHRTCRQHKKPDRDFYVCFGTYHPKCRPQPVQRYRCNTCRRTFSRQTFRADYRDRRPDLNQQLFLYMGTGIGLRQTARNLGLSLRATEQKFRKIARHLRRLNLNLRGQLSPGAILQFDELETFESRRNTRPLSVPILIERETRYIVWAEAAPIRPRGKMTKARKRAIREEEHRFGPRKDLSARSVRRTLTRGAELAQGLPFVLFQSDEKSTYPRLAREAFGVSRVLHVRTNSKVARMSWNPLFPINHTEAMARDSMSRLRRESWLASKKRRYLDLALQMWMAYRNLVRRRFNRDEESPAQMLGFSDRRLRPGDLLSWRQDWGRGSIHPLSRRGSQAGILRLEMGTHRSRSGPCDSLQTGCLPRRCRAVSERFRVPRLVQPPQWEGETCPRPELDPERSRTGLQHEKHKSCRILPSTNDEPVHEVSFSTMMNHLTRSLV